MTCVLAIDIGGTKLAAALVDEAGSILRSATRPTPRSDVMSALAALIKEVMDDGPPPQAVGIGCAGPVDLAAGTVSPVNMPSWRGFPLRREVRELTGLPTVLAGDAQCFALGEHWLGAGRDCASLLGVVVSTGIGGGLVIDGVPLLGPTGNAGHVGHMSIDPYGERCECGGRGCVERYSSGPNMTRWALENGWTPGTASSTTSTGSSPTGTGTGTATGTGSATGTGTGTGSPTLGAPGTPDSGIPTSLGTAGTLGSGAASPGTPSTLGSGTSSPGTATPIPGPHSTGSGNGSDTDSGGASLAPHGTPEKADARALAQDAAAGDPIAVAAFERGARALAGMIASTAAAVEINAVVIGGGVSAAGKVLFEPLEQALDDVSGLPFVKAVQVRQSTLGVRASLAGAAHLAWHPPPTS
ncbi:ROK family protein [Nonomuraea fuscirosea]|uniref:ROK family protein n=1 Tax=Nonomuraea fuscirosea TaxID=1291556 RepID=UPI0037A17DB7